MLITIDRKRSNSMKTLTTAGLLGLVILVSACTHPQGMYPAAGPGAGYGPGMRGGHGAGMMGGPGMVGGGYGAGMMGGHGHGHGPGMMGGPGMMWGLQRLDLTAEQRDKIAKIQDELQRQHWSQMQATHVPGGPQRGLLDEQAERQSYEAMAAAHKQMFESSLEARRRMLEVLTPQQREQLGRGGSGQ
jgi:Spy/CpxP family protein refolding chaperone